jgi:Glycosyl transferase family 2
MICLPSLAVVTPCSRPDTLPALKASIEPGRAYFDISWHVVFDANRVPPSVLSWAQGGDRVFSLGVEGSRVGNAQRNMALDNIEDGWVYFLDDDNLVHPELLPAMREAMEAHPVASAFVFPQIGGQNQYTKEARREHLRADFIDIAQIFWRRRTIGHARFEPVNAYNADGLFVEQIGRLQSGFEGFVFVNQPLCYYNAVRRT